MKLQMLLTAANAMCATTEIRKSYCTHTTTLLNLWKYLDREDITHEMKERKDAIEAIYKELQKKRKHADITDLSVEINNIVNEHIEIEVHQFEEAKIFDISAIDFDLLRREFAKSKEKNLILKDIQELLEERIAKMLAANPLRINFYEKYQEIIQDYNQEQNRATIEKTFEELMKLSHELTEEEKRYIREGFDNDEQLSMYDILFKNDLSKQDIKKLKMVAKDLLEKIKTQLATMDHPFDKQETQAAILISIRDLLWEELPDSYSDESINHYQDAIYNYVYHQFGNVA
jgi:type I restriction enzyme R subunit